jgi:membrane protease YdiL (CAAX protease family)
MIACFGIFFLAGMLFAIPLFGISLSKLTTAIANPEDPGAIRLLGYFQVIQSIGLFIIPPLLAGFFFHGNTLSYLKLDQPPSWKMYLLTLAVMICSLPFINMLVTFNESMTLPASMKAMEDWMKATEQEAARLTEAFMHMPTWSAFLFNILLIAVLPALGEELVFRGMLQRLFSAWLRNPHAAILLASVLFSAMHLQFYGFLPRMALGLILGYLFYFSGSLWVPILAHFIQNGTVVLVTWLGQQGWIGGDYENFGMTSNWLVISLSFIAVVGFLFLVKKVRHFG